MYKIIQVPNIAKSLLENLNLPSPNEGNTGGYRTLVYDSWEWEYSPIDLSVCILTVINDNDNLKNINDLSKWFINNPIRVGEVKCMVSIAYINTLNEMAYTIDHTVYEWKCVGNKYTSFNSLLKTNAPFTFR